MKFARNFILITLFFIFLLSIFLIGPIDRRPLIEKGFYQTTMNLMDTLNPVKYKSDSTFAAGWAREVIVPEFTVPMAGYKPRSQFNSVHDSLYVRVMLLNNGSATIALVSYDLLITPPLLEDRLDHLKLPGIDFIYFSASHTHNGIGGWDNSMGGQLMTGKYDDAILNFLEQKTIECLKNAQQSLTPSTISYFEVNAVEYVQNRLDPSSPEDGMIRGIVVKNAQKDSAILVTYSAHATNIPGKSHSLSNDYPGQLTQQLERKGYSQALFMAGTVGSHRLDNVPGESFERVENAGKKLSDLIVAGQQKDLTEDFAIRYSNIPIALGESHMRISKDLRLRDWAFRTFFRPLNAKIQYLQIGDILFLGMPCDFSGEIVVEKNLYGLAENLGRHLIITSFNGDYIGYITEDHHYETVKRAEVREMNWVGPYFGDYFNEIIVELIQK